DRPANLFVASFIGEPPMNILAVRVESEADGLRLTAERPGGGDAFAIDLAGAAPQLLAAIGDRRRLQLGIRPHLIEVGGAGPLAAGVVSNQWLGDQVPDLARRTAALAVTGQGDGTWLIDAAGDPVAPAWLWLDARSGAIVDRLRHNGVGEKVAQFTGTGLSCSTQSGQLLWLLE